MGEVNVIGWFYFVGWIFSDSNIINVNGINRVDLVLVCWLVFNRVVYLCEKLLEVMKDC